MEKKRLGVDVDDVIADFIPAFTELSRRLFKKPKPSVTWPSDWSWSNFELTSEDFKVLWHFVEKVPTFYPALKPCPDTTKLRALLKAHDVYFITARRTPDAQAVTAAWIFNKFRLSYAQGEFPVVLVAQDKIPLVKALNLDAFIDDKVETVEEIMNATECAPYLLARPHNINCSPYIERVQSFDEFAAKFLG